jgi:hypothetical protein
LLITTATADRVRLDTDPLMVTMDAIDPSGEGAQDLMAIYPGRSFRFCFTNRQMAEAVVDFVWSQPDLRPRGSLAPSLGAVAAGAGGGPMASTALLAAGHLPPVYAFRWLDDPYSIDLAERFRQVLSQPTYQPCKIEMHHLPYSVGGYLAPNPQEALAAGLLAGTLVRRPGQRPFLVLPTVDKPVRRFLHTLVGAAPLEIRNAVAVAGDSISFNVIYRDREFAWNSQDLPVTLVLFCHQNPVAWPEFEAGGLAQPYATATDDELLNAELMRRVLRAAYQPAGLLADAAELARQLHAGPADFFDPSGNRRGGSGEYVVSRRPHIEDGRVLASATIDVWHRQPGPDGPRWEPVGQPLVIDDICFSTRVPAHGGF